MGLGPSPPQIASLVASAAVPVPLTLGKSQRVSLED